MKFTVKSNELINTLKIVIKGYDHNDETSFVNLKVTENSLEITSRCKTAFFSGNVPITNLEVKDTEPTIYSVDGLVLKNLSGILPKSEVPISFSINSNARTFALSYAGNEFKLPILSDTTDVPKPEVTSLGTVQGELFIDIAKDLLKIVDNDSSAQENPSSCLHVSFAEETFRLLGTDRFAMAEITRGFSGVPEVFADEDVLTALIRHAQAALLIKTPEANEVFEILYSNEYFGYLDGEQNMVLVGRTDLQPLQIEQIKNAVGDDEYITIETESLRYALNTIARLSLSNLQPVTLIMDKEEQECNAKSMTGDILTIKCSDWNIEDDREVNFFRNVLQEALIPVSTEYVRLSWTDNGTATMYQLQPVEGDQIEEGTFLGVVPYVG